MSQSYDVGTLGLDDSLEVLRLLAEYPEIEARSFADGEYLLREGENSQEIFIVLKGALVVEQAAAEGGGGPVLLACVLAEPETIALVGEMAYLGALRRTASVKSSGRTHTLGLAPRHIDAILEGYPKLTRVICHQFSRRLQETDQALRSLQGRFLLSPIQRMGDRGEILFRQGEPAGSLYQLLAGSIRLEGPEGSRTVTPAELPQGFLEPAAYLAGLAHGVTATVEDMAFLAMVPAANREAWVRCFPELVLELLVAAYQPWGKASM